MLRAHLAKANEQVAHLEGDHRYGDLPRAQAYISPSWYATKREHGKVVPTWNYVTVQVRGTPVMVECRDWLRDQIDEMTSTHERGRADPWSLDDAPTDFIASQMKGIIGLEVPIERIEGKWKVSQNQSMPNRIGVEAVYGLTTRRIWLMRSLQGGALNKRAIRIVFHSRSYFWIPYPFATRCG